MKKKKVRILLLGGGAREYAFALAISQSPLCEKLYIAPGNWGTTKFGENVDLNPMDFMAVFDFCIKNNTDVVIPGSEDPLVAGITDFLNSHQETEHISVVGPPKAGAEFEGSKAFAKSFMQEHNIPTANYKVFTEQNFEEGIEYVNTHSLPIVIKASGLAAGKGVLICNTHEEAVEAYKSMKASFGEAGATVVVEEFLTGVEFSVFILTDGLNYKILPVAKDYKRVGVGDSGPNTGGMGAVSPVPFVTKGVLDAVETRIIKPTLAGMRKRNIIYRGFLYLGLILVNGEPFVIEYNCRMGDPETPVVFLSIKEDILELMLSIHDGTLKNKTINQYPGYRLGVVLAANGYPDSKKIKKGEPLIVPINTTPNIHTTCIAGIKAGENDVPLTNGGRLLVDVFYRGTLSKVLDVAKEYMEDWTINEGVFYRSDIGKDLLHFE